MKTIKVMTEAKYVSHNVKANKSLDLTVDAPYSELVNYIQTIQMLNENVEVGARIGSDKPVKLGSFMIHSVRIDNDGEGRIKLNSQLDFVNTKEINELANRNEEPLKLLLKADIDVDEDEE